MVKMVNNKVLIKLYVPTIGKDYDVFIPVNEFIWKVNKLLVKSVSDLTDGTFPIRKNYALINANSGKIYNNNEVIINTDIRNTTELALIEI